MWALESWELMTDGVGVDVTGPYVGSICFANFMNHLACVLQGAAPEWTSARSTEQRNKPQHHTKKTDKLCVCCLLFYLLCYAYNFVCLLLQRISPETNRF